MPATSYYAPNQQCVHSDCSGPARSTEGNGGTMAVDGTGVTGRAMGPEGFSIQSTQTSPSSFTFGTDESSTHTNHWDFGDGVQTQTPVGQTVDHTYSTAGEYTVTCTCHGDTAMDTIVATGGETTLLGVFVIDGLNVTARLTGGVPNQHLRYWWGDGQNGDVTLDDQGAGELSHTYQATGTYRGSAMDDQGNMVGAYNDIVVPGNIATERIITYGHSGWNYEFLLLDAAWQPISGELVQWDFGDGVTAADADVALPISHTYTTTGTMIVKCAFPGNEELLAVEVTGPSPDPPPANPPTLTAISPTVTNAGAGQFGVTIYGTDFQNDMVGVTAARPEIATTFIDTETAGIMLDTTVDVVAGQISFYVVNPDGQRSSESLAVEIVPDPPYIDTVTPNMWNAYTLQQLVIAGTGFVVESTAWLEDSATHMTELTMLSQDATTITCRYEGGAASSGPGQVTVKNSETAFSNGVNVLLTSG